MTLSSSPEVSHPKTVVTEVTGPVSYVAGTGVEVNFSDQLSSVLFADLCLISMGATLPAGWFPLWALDAPSPGRVRFRLFRPRYQLTSIPGAVTGQPSGVAVRGTSGSQAQSVNALSGTGNAHTENQLYEHTHTATQTQTDLASVELSSVNLATTRWKILVVGV